MQKAILLGNGFSSYLIESYTNETLLAEMKCCSAIEPIWKHYRKLFSNFDDCKNPSDFVNKLKKLGFSTPTGIYELYFEKYNLKAYVGEASIYGIETLLKIGQLFQEIECVEIGENEAIRQFACDFYWNDGRNGKNAIIKGVDYNKFSALFNSYALVFTTNYDSILDDIFKKTVFHLHGGFCIDKHGCIKGVASKDNSLLIWGVDDNEKVKQIDAVSRSLSYNSPNFLYNDKAKYNMQSDIDKYFESLVLGNFSELDIVGYSGENDKHINSELVKNGTLKHINFYCAPSQVHDQNHYKKVSGMFDGKFSVDLICWNKFWNRFMEGNTLCQTNDLN